MFKRFWQSLNDWAEALSMDDPRGGYMFVQAGRSRRKTRARSRRSSDPVPNDAGRIAG